MSALRAWLERMWTRAQDPGLAESYRATFASEHGHRVLNHLIEHVYASVCEVYEPIALATHNGRRSVVQEILENIDLAEHPHKYQTPVETSHG